jgi:hypothetical protein
LNHSEMQEQIREKGQLVRWRERRRNGKGRWVGRKWPVQLHCVAVIATKHDLLAWLHGYSKQ